MSIEFHNCSSRRGDTDMQIHRIEVIVQVIAVCWTQNNRTRILMRSNEWVRQTERHHFQRFIGANLLLAFRTLGQQFHCEYFRLAMLKANNAGIINNNRLHFTDTNTKTTTKRKINWKIKYWQLMKRRVRTMRPKMAKNRNFWLKLQFTWINVRVQQALALHFHQLWILFFGFLRMTATWFYGVATITNSKFMNITSQKNDEMRKCRKLSSQQCRTSMRSSVFSSSSSVTDAIEANCLPFGFDFASYFFPRNSLESITHILHWLQAIVARIDLCLSPSLWHLSNAK